MEMGKKIYSEKNKKHQKLKGQIIKKKIFNIMS